MSGQLSCSLPPVEIVCDGGILSGACGFGDSRFAAATELVSRLRGQKVKHQDGYILVPETLVAGKL